MQTRQQKKIATNLESILKEFEEAKLVKNKYRTLRAVMRRSYPTLIDNVERDVMISFMKDVIYADRKLRQLTEGVEQELKDNLEKKAQAELGYNTHD